MLKKFLSAHIFKIIGAAAGLVLGLGFFGLVFGLIAGVFIDQLTAGTRQKKLLKGFISSPAPDAERSDLFINSAAVITGWILCRGDSARRTLFRSAANLYFPEAPPYCIDILIDREQAGLDTDALSAALYFGLNSADEQKNRLRQLLKACGLERSGRSDYEAELLKAAGIERPEAEKCGRDEDYAVLGLKPGAAPPEVKRVYRKLAAQFHPDGSRHLSEAQQKITEEAFIRIKAAYERLVN